MRSRLGSAPGRDRVASGACPLAANLSKCSIAPRGGPAAPNEVLLDSADGLDRPAFCECDCLFAIPREELKQHRGTITLERRRQIVRTIIQSHGWNLL